MAQRASGYAPRAHDKFYTPAWVIKDDLARHWQPPAHCQIWEPCAGDGGMAKAIVQAFNRPVLATDLKPDRKQQVPVALLDFLKSSGPSRSAAPLIIITNVPYSAGKIDRFVEHALNLTYPHGTVIMLLPFGYDAGRSRRRFFECHPAFACKITTSRRIRWANIEQKENGPSGDHSLFIWEWQTRRRQAYAGSMLRVAE